MRARERGEYELSGIGMAGMDGNLVAVFGHAYEIVDIRTVQLGIDPLTEHVHGQSDETHIAGALAIAEERAFDTVRSRHEPKLGRRNRRAAVIVGMERYDDAVAISHIAAEPFDLIGMDIGCRDLDRVRQVENELLLRRRLIDIHDRLANLLREFELGAHEALGRIFMAYALGEPLLALEPLDQLSAPDRDIPDAGLVEPEHHPTLQLRGRVVEMDDCAVDPLEAFEGPADQLVARLGQHLDGDVRRNSLVVDEEADEIEVGLRSRREADLDLLEADGDERIEHPHLAIMAHGLDQ